MEDYTREDIAQLINRSASTVAQMCYKGKVPCKPYTRDEDVYKIRWYDKTIIDQWVVANAALFNILPRPNNKRPAKKKTKSMVSFKEIFAGKFLPHQEKMSNFSRLATAQASRPVTQRVSFKGVY